MSQHFCNFLETTALSPAQITLLTREIHAEVLAKSKYLDAPNFESIHSHDLRLLLDLYDQKFFDGQVEQALGQTSLRFELSKRMTRSGGMTKKFRNRNGSVYYEISAATSILFGCFENEPHRPIQACGIVCRDRLDALQRIMEHEITHLIEFLVWNTSSCSKPRFQSITHRFFGHTEHKHQLMTPRERAQVKFGIQPGMLVRFQFEGIQHQGVVNRITKRATVLVENPSGTRYSNGKYYLKFYIPVAQLAPVE